MADTMTFRGLCEHGKVRCMMTEPGPNSSPAWVKNFWIIYLTKSAREAFNAS